MWLVPHMNHSSRIPSKFCLLILFSLSTEQALTQYVKIYIKIIIHREILDLGEDDKIWWDSLRDFIEGNEAWDIHLLYNIKRNKDRQTDREKDRDREGLYTNQKPKAQLLRLLPGNKEGLGLWEASI